MQMMIMIAMMIVLRMTTMIRLAIFLLWMGEILHHLDDMFSVRVFRSDPPGPPQLNVVNSLRAKLHVEHLTEILHHPTPDPTLNLGGAGGSRDCERGQPVR